MTVPFKTDPKWQRFLRDLNNMKPTDLSTRMLLSRLKLKIALDPSASSRAQVIGEAYEFFSKNQSSVAEDIRKIFG